MEEDKKVTLFSVAKEVREVQEYLKRAELIGIDQKQVEDLKLAIINIDKRLALLEQGEFTPGAKRKIAGFIKTITGQVAAPQKLNNP